MIPPNQNTLKIVNYIKFIHGIYYTTYSIVVNTIFKFVTLCNYFNTFFDTIAKSELMNYQ